MSVSYVGLTVVIPHYGDPAPTRALVASLARQASVTGAEIIVVDDASPQALGEIPSATTIRRESNGGFGAAVNTGVELARGELVAILNSDLIVEPDFLASYVAAADPWLPAVVAPRLIEGGKDSPSTFRFPKARTVLAQRIGVVGNRRDRPWVSKLIGEDRPRLSTMVHHVDWVVGCGHALPTREFLAVGGFDERFHMYLEEVDLQRRLRARGIPAVYVGARGRSSTSASARQTRADASAGRSSRGWRMPTSGDGGRRLWLGYGGRVARSTWPSTLIATRRSDETSPRSQDWRRRRSPRPASVWARSRPTASRSTSRSTWGECSVELLAALVVDRHVSEASRLELSRPARAGVM